MNKQESEKIEKIKSKFKKEWLLIRPIKVDKLANPVRGILLAHSKSREEIYHLAKKMKEHIYITFSDDFLPKGYAVAFYAKIYL